MDGSSRSLVDIANKEVSIWHVCSLVGVSFAGFYGTNAKLYCPFGRLTHLDGGREKAFRVYPETNTSYCFGCSQFFDSVGLYSEFSDLSREDSAEALLYDVGWKEKTYEERWNEMQQEVSEFDTNLLPTTLDLFCSSLDSEWEIKSIESPYREVYGIMISLLPKVTNLQEATAWLDFAKARMRKVLEK